MCETIRFRHPGAGSLSANLSAGAPNRTAGGCVRFAGEMALYGTISGQGILQVGGLSRTKGQGRS
jgi:hypothetical protein